MRTLLIGYIVTAFALDPAVRALAKWIRENNEKRRAKTTTDDEDEGDLIMEDEGS